MMSEETKQFNRIFETIGQSLDISESQYKKAVEHYEAVGAFLASPGSPLSIYRPEIMPQGSFLLGTVIKPVNEDDELDIDLVCRIEDKKPEWTQNNLKQTVGDWLKQNGQYQKMLDKEGRRCWTLNYKESPKFHMDILPAIVGKNYKFLLESVYADTYIENDKRLAIRITDKTDPNYPIETNPINWPISNPFGYARWFQDRCSVMTRKSMLFMEGVKPVPAYSSDKSILQRVVQILKRHRDILFNGDEDKPISIIITTLAGLAYQKEENLFDALINVAGRMQSFIRDIYSPKHEKFIKWIGNPVNLDENFADRWSEPNKKQINFYKWLEKLNTDLKTAIDQKGIDKIQKSLELPLGQKLINESFVKMADDDREARISGQMHMARASGILGIVGTQLQKHNFHGNE